MKIVAKVDNTNKIHLPAEVMRALKIKGGDELVWNITETLVDEEKKYVVLYPLKEK